jgi:hypothetical protein
MTTTEDHPSPAGVTPNRSFTGYVEALETQGAPLGHLVLYSIFSGEVTPAAAAGWFRELGLDHKFAPGDIRAADVYEKITGPTGVHRAYPIGPVQSPEQRRRDGRETREALLMIRHVSRSPDRIVRHLVREVRDEERTQLTYNPRLAVLTFVRDGHQGADPGGGALQIEPDYAAIATLPRPEQAHVDEVLDEVRHAFDRGRLYLSGDRLRTTVRTYIESLHPIRIRPTGGVYFVAAQHAATLAALRELVGRFGGGSNLARVPLPDLEEMRDMVISAFVTRSKEELDKLGGEIRKARDAGAGTAAIQALHRRFTDLQAAASEHEQLLGGAIDDAQASMQLVQLQLASLLARAT